MPLRITGVDHQIGLRIRAQRMALGLSQTNLANAVGVTFQQIQKYEKGMNGVRGSRLEMIAKALKVKPQFFFGSDKQESVETDKLLAEPGAIALLRAFSKLPTGLRVALRNLTVEMSGE